MSATALYWRYQRALSEGNQEQASALWREYCRAVEAEAKA